MGHPLEEKPWRMGLYQEKMGDFAGRQGLRSLPMSLFFFQGRKKAQKGGFSA
jgi:hypothetical protein